MHARTLSLSLLWDNPSTSWSRFTVFNTTTDFQRLLSPSFLPFSSFSPRFLVLVLLFSNSVKANDALTHRFIYNFFSVSSRYSIPLNPQHESKNLFNNFMKFAGSIFYCTVIIFFFQIIELLFIPPICGLLQCIYYSNIHVLNIFSKQ